MKDCGKRHAVADFLRGISPLYPYTVASRIRTEFLPDPVRKLYDIYHCCVYSEKFLAMIKGNVRNMWIFILKINLEN